MLHTYWTATAIFKFSMHALRDNIFRKWDGALLPWMAATLGDASG